MKDKVEVLKSKKERKIDLRPNGKVNIFSFSLSKTMDAYF